MQRGLKHRIAASSVLFAACLTTKASTIYSNMVLRSPVHGDQSASGPNGVILDDVLVPNALNPSGGPIGVRAVTFGILREANSPAVTVTGYYGTTFTPRVDSFPQLKNPPVSFGSGSLDAYGGTISTIQTLTITPSSPIFVTPQTTDVPGYNEFAIGVGFSLAQSGNYWAVAVPNSPDANLDGAWDYDIPSNTNQAYSLADATGPIYTTFMMSITSTLPSIWNTDSDGTWSSTGNWLGGVPSSNDDAASFGNAITVPRTISLDVPQTLGSLNFNNANRYTISGSATLTLSANATAAINVVQGSHTIATPVFLSTNTIATVSPPNSTLTISGSVTAAAGVTLTKAGAGTLEVKNVRMDGLAINAGTVRVLSNGTAAGTSNVKSLSIAGSTDAWAAKLDLADNSLVVDYTTTNPRATIENQIKSGLNGGAWNGNGITSSAAAGARGMSLGIAEASDIFTTFPASFRGQSVDATSVLVRYTVAGDANLDGTVNTLDFNELATSFNASGARWFKGDFNFDGVVNALDFNILATHFGLTAPGPPVGSSLVPECASLALTATILGGSIFPSRARPRSRRGK